jgi:hypothetical protein
VFFLKSICRSRYFGQFIGLIMVAFIILLPAVAAADGETYTWKDSQHSAIEATGGPYAGTTEFTKQADNSYTATGVALNCSGGSTATSTGTSTITTANSGQFEINNGSLTAPAGCTPQTFTSQFTIAGAAAATTTNPTGASTGTCDQGSVSWLMCPVINNISNSVSNLAKDVLAPLLEVNHISPKSTPALYQSWGHIRDFADVLFILIFIAIIIGTVTEQDIGALSRYHIKTIWPRLVIAAILVQFSFFFSGIIIDIGNVLGAGIQTLLISVTNPTATSSPANLIGNLVAGGVGVVGGTAGVVGAVAVLSSWTVAFPIILSLLISLLVAFLTLGARFLIIAILVVISPLAMTAWVLPNTEHFFKSWNKIMVRLVMMYPIIIGVITLAGIVNQILPFSGDTANSGLATTAVAILKPLIVVAAFLVIPMSFRYAGKGMEQVTGFISNAGKLGKGAIRDSSIGQRGKEARQRRQASLMNQWMNSGVMSKLQSNGGFMGRAGASALTSGVGLAMMNAPKDKASLQRMQSRLINDAAKELENMDEATVPNLHKVHGAFAEPDIQKRKENRAKLKRDAPNLYQLATTVSGQAAVTRRLTEMGATTTETVRDYAYAGSGGNIFRATNNPQAAYSTVLKQMGKEFSKKPGVIGRVTEAQAEYEVKDVAGNVTGKVARLIGDIDLNLVGGAIGRVSAKSFGDDHNLQNFKVMDTRGNANTSLDLAAQEMSRLYAERLDRNVVSKAMDVNNRQSNMTPESRLEWMRNIQKNNDIFRAENPDILKLSSEYLEADQDLTNNLLKEMGADKIGAVKALSATGRAHVVRDWMYGQNYDPWHPDYESSGKVIP